MKVELSIIPVLIGVFTLGLGDGFIILFIRSILWYLLFNQGPSTWIGVPMNFIALGIFMAIVWFFTKKKFLNQNYTVGCGFSSHRISSCDDGIECFLRYSLSIV